MTRRIRELERVETRVLGALRFVDAGTGQDIAQPLVLRALEGRARFVSNRSGIHVIAWWSRLAAHEAAFRDPPAAPPVGDLTLPLAVADDTGHYLPRRVSVRLPRDPDPAHAAQPESLFTAVPVAMYPAAVAATGANWSVLHVSVSETHSGDLLGGVLLRVLRDHDVIARGLTDGRGEALVPLVGVPMLTFGHDDKAVVVDHVNVKVEAVFDPATGTRLAAAALAAGARAPVPEVDPDVLDDAHGLPHTAQTLAVAARRSQSLPLTLSLP